MALEGVNRYAELIKAIPPGPFYDSRGIVVPYRHGNHEVRLETDNPNTTYILYIAGVYSGSVVSDINGNVVFSRHLDRGENEIRLVNSETNNTLISYVTVREYALWLIAYAETFESIDDDWKEAYDDIFIETVTVNGIEGRFGRDIQTYNNIGQSLDDYRWLLHELRLAYRNYGGRFRGFETAVAEFTQIPQFGYSRRLWGPNWTLDQSMLINARWKERSHVVSYNGAGITGVALDRVEADVPSGVAARVIQYDATLDSLRWGTFLTPGPYVPANDGLLFLPGPPSTVPAFILGLAGPFALAAAETTLYIDDGTGTIIVPLVTGWPTPTAAQVVGDINTAMGYALASVYNGKVLLVNPASQPLLEIEHGANNAAVRIFGVEPGNLTFAPNVMNGVTIVSISGSVDVNANSEIAYRYDGSVTPPTRELRWRSPLAAWSPWVSISGDGTYSLIDGFGYTLKVHCYEDDMDVLSGPWPATTSVLFSVGYGKEARQIEQTGGLWVYVDRTQLPAINTFDFVDVFDDASTPGVAELPDNWWLGLPLPTTSTVILESRVVTDKIDLYDPSPAFRVHLQDSGARVHELFSRVLQYPMPRPGPRGQNYPQQSPGLFYDYEGFKAKFSGWVSSTTVGPTTATLSFSFDNGATWVSSAPFPVVQDTGGFWYEDFTYIEFETIIPAGLTDNGVLVAVTIDDPVGIDVMLDSFRVDVEYITSRVLTSNTVVRTRHRQYFGELAWTWSVDPLSLLEKEYIGLPHKRPDKTVPISGVTVTDISMDTDPGNGTVDYEYNSLGDIHRLRWNAPNAAWGPGLGWVSILSAGAYVLPASDGSSMTTLVDYALLPVLDGTPPGATITRSVTITDTTIRQGHVRRISPAHSSIDIFDVTEYNSDNVPINLKGAVTEGDFSSCTLTNLDIHASSPFRYSYLLPNLLPVEDEPLTFSVAAPYVAPLLYDSDQDQEYAMLFEDGILVPNDQWWFNSASEVQVATAYYNSGATYTISYNPICVIETPLLDLGALTYQDYVWFADYMLWDRMEHNVIGRIVTVPLFFNPDIGRTTLEYRSSMDMAVSKLYIEDADGRREISTANWRFIDPTTVEMDASQFVGGAVYYLEHEEIRMYRQSALTITFEHRSGVDAPSCLAAGWNTIQRNENVDVNQSPAGHLIHQLRLSVSNIRDLSDFKIRSLVLKGLHMFGSNPDIPGLTNV